ncbi:MAG: hypothetical protein ABI609_06115 [Acidobacteriota bacterium]
MMLFPESRLAGCRRLSCAAALLAGLSWASSAVAQESASEIREMPDLAGNPEWKALGSFDGSRSPEATDLLSDEIFKESRNGELFQDLGDLQFELGHAFDKVDLTLLANFKRRVVERHKEIEPGGVVGTNDFSYFQSINSALGKGRLKVDYLGDRLDPFRIGLATEAGFVITVASTEPLHALAEGSSRRLHVGTASEEMQQYWTTHGVHFNRQILHDAGRGLADFIGLLAGQIGRHFEDTEQGAVFFEGFAEPITVWADLGVPIRADLFNASNTELQSGDAVSYLAFVEVAPVSLGMDRWGARVNFKGFLRFLRETTIVKRADDIVLVRVKNVAARGLETTPLKIRPEVKLLFLNYGYTLLNDRFDNSGFRASEIVYRIDLKNPVAAAAFTQLLGTGHRVQFKPLLQAAEQRAGVEILNSSYRDGKRREHSFLARFPSWFRADRNKVSVLQEIQTPSERYVETTSAGYQNLHQNWWHHRQRSRRSILTLRSDPQPLDAPVDKQAPPETLSVRLEIHDHEADSAKIGRLAALLRGILGSEVHTPEVADLRPQDASHREGVSLSLDIDAGRAQIEKAQDLDDRYLWRALAEFYLGPALQDTWANAASRSGWTARRPNGRNRPPTDPPIARRLDAWFGNHPAAARGIGFDGRTSAADLFRKAEGFVRHWDHLRSTGKTGRGCIECWSELYSDPDDVAFLELLLVRVAGGASHVGYAAEIFTDSMFRPLRLTNTGSAVGATVATTTPGMALAAPPGTSSGPFQHTPLATGSRGVSDTGVGKSDSMGKVPDADWIDSSDARLRAGRMYREAASGRVRLELYSDYRFDENLMLRAELRRSLLRSDVFMQTRMLDLPAPVAVKDSPFMVAKYRYDIELPWTTLDRKHAYAIYMRIINRQGLPVTEEEAVRFRERR